MSEPVILVKSPHTPQDRVAAYDRRSGFRAESDAGLSLAEARKQAVNRLRAMLRRTPGASGTEGE